MRYIGKLLAYLILGFNLLSALGLLFSSYSPYINPENHPLFSLAGLAFPLFLVINIAFLVFWLICYKKYALLSFVSLLLCISQIRTYFPVNFPAKHIPDKTFKLLSYNVMAFDDKKHTQNEPNPIIEYIQSSNADIICLQEFIMGVDKYHLQKEDVDKALKAYPYRTYHKVGWQNRNGLACYSKYPILSARTIDYTSMYNGSAIYELDIDGDTVLVINNHLESNKLTIEDKAAYVDMIKAPETKKVSNGLRMLIRKLAEASKIRAHEAQIIAAQIDSLRNKTIIVCGDFNDVPISYTHRVIAENLKDAFVRSGNGLGISYNQNGFYFRIDNILISKNLKSYDCTVDRSIKESDHYPIWCYIGKEE